MGVALTVSQQQTVEDLTDVLTTVQLKPLSANATERLMMMLIVDLTSLGNSLPHPIAIGVRDERDEQREKDFRRGARTIIVDDTMHAFKITAKEHAFTRAKPHPILKQNKPLPYKHQTNNQRRQLYGAPVNRRTKAKK